ncbi:hypothetical protein EDB81DRAFT_887583 [Dactylonectria macrodidyma]|uniref:NAD(P)-binding protein n=1 Tax=Dactylonectria macrodidyma TaxID=307937 RepID=A0A9P9IUC9_9HYPO|nr:hypothetical protein EDB81DRAFT_887583 [Dactylonectria macrodidyma]
MPCRNYLSLGDGIDVLESHDWDQALAPPCPSTHYITITITITMSTTNVLITGANRGVGLAFLQTYLAQPNHIVIGSVRDIARSSNLNDLPVALGSKLVLVKIESSSFSDPAEAVGELKALGISRLDIVIANAGVAGGAVVPATNGDADDFLNTLAINAVGPLALFAATWPLLEQAVKPKWVSISSAVASLANHEAMFAGMGGRPMGAGYGASKAALNHLSLNIHSENPKLTVLVVDPGFLDTDMGNRGAKILGIEKPPHNAGDNAKAMVKLVDAATRETHSGKFWTFDSKEVPW